MSWPLQTQRDAFYGNPRNKTNPAKVDPAWDAANLVRVDFPWQAVLAWDTDTSVRSIRIHRRCAQSLVRILAAIWTASGKDQATIESWGMHLYGGGFEYRPVRGGKGLSSHSWGCAVDFDPVRNGYGDTTPNFANVPQVLKAFADEGWEWGGPWRPKADGMHFQAARTR